MDVTVTIHQAWLARPTTCAGSWPYWPASRSRRPRWPRAKPGPSPPPITRHPPPTRRSSYPKAVPGPDPEPAGSGRCLGAPGRRAGPRRADRRETTPRLGVEAGPGHERPADRLRREDHSKIVEWTPQQVAAAYRFARGRLHSTTR